MSRSDAQQPLVPFGDSETARQLAELRTAVAEVALSRASSLAEIEQARDSLRDLGRRANQIIRATDVRTAGDLIAGQCFAARALVAEARRQLATEGKSPADAVPTLGRARRALYRALCLVVRSLSQGFTLPPTSGFVTRPASRVIPGAESTFVRLVRSVSSVAPVDMIWALEVAECELAIAILDRRGLDEERLKSLSALHDEISVWANAGHDANQGAALLERVRARAEELA
jgi:hypothetical protein